MKNVTSKSELSHSAIESKSHLFDDWFDPIEDMIRGQVRGLIEEMIRGELDATLSRPRYGRRAGHAEGSDLTAVVTGHRHGSRVRTLTGTFGKAEIAVPRARLNGSGGKTTEWKSQVLRNYQRRTRAADALIAGTYLAGTNTRRVPRALRSVFGGEVGKDTVSRLWRKVKLGEQRAGRHQLVVGNATALGASSKFEPQEDVGDAGRVEAVLQRRAVEVGQPRSWARSDIRNRTDLGRFQQSLESRPVMVGVSNAEDERHLV